MYEKQVNAQAAPERENQILKGRQDRYYVVNQETFGAMMGDGTSSSSANGSLSTIVEGSHPSCVAVFPSHQSGPWAAHMLARGWKAEEVTYGTLLCRQYLR